MNRSTVIVHAPLAAATAVLAVTTSIFGYLAVTSDPGSVRAPGTTSMTTAERDAVGGLQDIDARRAASFGECPQGPVHPAQAC